MVDSLREGDPSQVGPYRLEGRLGVGGMGQVFLGRSPGGFLVAVKMVRPELADDVGFRRRFADEVRAARKVGGFYTAEVVAADTDADQPWLATAYIPGLSLQQAVTDHGPLPVESVAILGAGLAEGLAAVHAEDLVHRDLKPANVILAAGGPRLIDFGIARALDSTSYTQTRMVLGTAAFMSPEQAIGDKVGQASDVFSLGCVLAFAATGRSPFGTGPPHAVTYRVVHGDPDLSGLPAPLTDLVGRCLNKDPAARPGLDVVLDEVAKLAPPDWGRGEGQWLPEAITEIITQRQTRVLPPIEPVRTPSHERADPQAGGPAPAVFEVTTTSMRVTKRAIGILKAILLPTGLFAAIVLLGLLFSDFQDVDKAVAFAWDLSTSAWALWLFPGIAVLEWVFDEGSDGHDQLTVDTQGLVIVDKRRARWRDRSFLLPWARLEHIRVMADSSGPSHLVVVEFKDGHEPDKDWGKRHNVPREKGGHVVAKISVRNAERAAMIPRLRAALADFGGEVYTEDAPPREHEDQDKR